MSRLTHAASARLEWDPTACTGHGLCAAWLPERITLDEWGYPVVDGNDLDPEVLTAAKRAARECPVRALRIRRP